MISHPDQRLLNTHISKQDSFATSNFGQNLIKIFPAIPFLLSLQGVFIIYLLKFKKIHG